MKKKQTKHIPNHSAFIIIKFKTNEQLKNLIDNEDFHLFKSKLDSIAVKNGGKCEFFTTLL